MPRFGLFNKIHEKLEEAKISDLNYELGKFAQGSAAYFGSLKSDAGSLLTNKFWKTNARPTPGLSKSVSLPTGFQRAPENNNLRDEKVAGSSKYKYRSSVIVEDDDDDDGDIEFAPRSNPSDSANVVDRFIRVIESKDQVEFRAPEPRLKSREEIRKKLAFGGPDPHESRKGAISKKAAADLEVCFINDAAFDDDAIKEEEDEPRLPAAAESEAEVGQDPEPSGQPTRFPRSKSDWEAFRNPNLLSVAGATQQPSGSFRGPTLSDLQAEAALALTKCQKIARRKLEAERLRREIEESKKLRSLIGRDIGKRLCKESLEELNSPTLQVIVNNFLNRIEQLNEELVNLLLEKDELQIEQDSQLVDIDDLSQPSSREQRLIF